MIKRCLATRLLLLLAILVASGASLLNSSSNEDPLVHESVSSEAEEIELGVTRGNYGADISWPMSHSRVSTNFAWLPHIVDPENNPIPEEYIGMPIQPLGDRQKAYEEFMQGCRNAAKEQAIMCDHYDESRTHEGLNQPVRMMNFTELGFKKIRAPKALFTLIKEFWEANKHLETPEEWGVGSTITNNFFVPSTMVSVENESLLGGGDEIKDKIWHAANDIIQEWTGQESFPTSVYGIRVYKEGAILSTHVDRLPLVSSMIINVDQDVDEEWPLEVIGHDGRAYNVTQKPGDIILYESHSILHGRPFALKGRYYANIFVHFAPKTAGDYGSAFAEYDLSNTLVEDSDAQDPWYAAANGKVSHLKKISEKNSSLLFKGDKQLWQPIHEAARGGSFAAIEYLVQEGADINALTIDNETVLDLAIMATSEQHPMVQKLRDLGATSLWEDHEDKDEESIQKFSSGDEEEEIENEEDEAEYDDEEEFEDEEDKGEYDDEDEL